MAEVPYGDYFTGRGAGAYTARLTDVDPTDGVKLTFGFQASEVLVHWEKGNVGGRYKGTRDGSEMINITEDGLTVTLPIVRPKNDDWGTVYPPGDAASDVSIIAW